jgi:hypothetical protein
MLRILDVEIIDYRTWLTLQLRGTIMAYSLTSPITGAAQTGFTAPTYTHITDIAPDNNGKQNAVTALGGTQTGVTTHSVASPFTITMSRPRVFKSLGKPNPVTGLVNSVPMNVYKLLTRKGVSPLVNQPYATMIIRTEIQVPAGSDTYDAANVRAALAAHGGALAQQSAGIGDSAVSGVL